VTYSEDLSLPITDDAVAEGSWIGPVAAVPTMHRQALFMFDPAANDLPLDGVVFGAAGTLPEINQLVADQFASAVNGQLVLPKLGMTAIRELDLYEVRRVTEGVERSVTYHDPSMREAGLMNDWSAEEDFTAATLRYEGDHLVTVFANGQIWFEEMDPRRVPGAVRTTVGRLWRMGSSAA
jgi:hypothetical protein